MITIVGSVNLDIVASGTQLPRPGETVSGAILSRHPGGKGANQALGLRRLNTEVRLLGAVGRDDMAQEAVRLLQAGGVDLSGLRIIDTAPTGVALIAVNAEGENQIIVCPGANRHLSPRHIENENIRDMMGVLEIPVETLLAAARKATGFVGLNLAPAIPVPDELLSHADLLVVNETEAAFFGDRLHDTGALIAVSRGGEGAELWKDRTRLASARPPPVEVVDTTGAGDMFCAALFCSLSGGEGLDDALSFAVTAGALACTRPGAQTGLPDADEIRNLLRQRTGS